MRRVGIRIAVGTVEGVRAVVEDGEPVVGLRTWTEGLFKRFMPIFNDARDDALPTLYERIETEG